MSKRIYFILIILSFLLLRCDSKNSWDCVQTPGSEIVFDASVEEFHSVTALGHVDLVLIQDSLRRIKVETRKNLVDNIQFSTEDGMLFIEDKSSCNILRKRSYTTVYVYAPVLYSIRNASTGTIRNEGVWRQDKISLISDDYQNSSYHNNGVFLMNLELQELSVLTNGHSYFKLEGTAEKAEIAFYSGNARLEANAMQIQEIDVYHRGTNHMLLYPVQAIRGEILSTGDVRIYNLPPIIEVEEKYLGTLEFIE